MGDELKNLRLYTCQEGAWSPVRFQVDERTREGDWIFPYGKRNNGWRSNRRLGPQDVILFMARDAGEQGCDPGQLQGTSSVVALDLRDPTDGREASVLLASHRDPAPPQCTLPPYVNYDPESEIVSSVSMQSEYLITENGEHTGFYTSRVTPPEAGGTGENYVDRLKFRAEIRFFFNLIPLRVTEQNQGSDVVAHIRGPVRVLRRQEQFVRLPFGIRGLKGIADVALYENIGTVPVKVSIPRGMGRIVSSAHAEFGTDYAPSVIGSFFKNDRNPDPMIVDGIMSPSEERFDTTLDDWRIFYGPCGVLMTRIFFPPELKDTMELRQKYLDDLETRMPPDRFPGSIGFAYTEGRPGKDIPHGDFLIPLDFYYPPNYRPGDETHYLKIRDEPLRIRIENREYVNPVDIPAEIGEDF